MIAAKVDSAKLCPCGQYGKTYGECCELKGDNAFGNAIQRHGVPVLLKGARTPILSSWVGGDIRFRIIWNALWTSPQDHTFHQFLDSLLHKTFGAEWFEQQRSLAVEKQHVVFRWRSALFALLARTKTSADEKQIRSIRTGPVEAYLCFAYDLFWLQINYRLPDRIVERLKDWSTFQSARYEVLIAAIFARAGFDIEWLDDVPQPGKHCEFVATHRERGTKIAVETKSRLRSGAYHFLGPISAELRGDIFDLYDKAVKQGPSDGTAYLIFIDTNLNARIPPGVPGYAHMPAGSIPWMDQIGQELKVRRGNTGGKTPENGVFITNYSFHYGNEEENSPVGMCGYFPSLNPVSPLEDRQLMDDLVYCMKYYTEVPRQL